jgi:DNA-binding CsgD family transcriptional regulator
MATLTARAAELEQGLPFGVAEQLLGRPGDRFDEVAGRLPPDVNFALIERYGQAFLDVVRPESGGAIPTMVVVDDVHWADESSLRLLFHLTLRLEPLPIALVLATRPPDDSAAAMVLKSLLASPTASVVSPQPLSRAAVGRLLLAACGAEASPELAAACTRVTGGNPFYVVELLRELATTHSTISVDVIEQAAPHSVLRVVLARLARLGPAASELAIALAVAGDGARLRTVAALARVDPSVAEQAADALAGAEFVLPGEPLRFTHPLIASTLRGDMGAFARARAHRRAAELLAGEGAPAERIAPHLLHANPEGDARVVAWLQEAATAASTHGEPQLASKLLTRALGEPPGDGERGAILLQLAEAEAQQGSPLALDHLRSALEVMADSRQKAVARLALARTLHHAGDFAEAANLADQCRRGLSPDDPLQERALSTWLAAAFLHPTLRNREVPAAMARIVGDVDSGRAPTDPALRALVAAWLTGLDEPAAPLVGMAKAAFADDPLVDADSRGGALGYAAASLVYLDALDVAETLLDAAIDTAQKRGAVIALSIACHFRAQANLHRGRVAEALADAERALEIYRSGWNGSAWSTPTLTLIHLARGDLEQASQAVALGEEAGHHRVEWAMLLEARARLRIAQGRPHEALADARDAGRRSDAELGVKSCRVFDWVRIAALAAHAAGLQPEAHRLAEESLGRGRASGGRHLGIALMTAGTIEGGGKGLNLLAEACLELERSPAHLAFAEAELEYGRALRRSGKGDDARERLYRAFELAGPMGAEAIVSRARSELAELGLRPRRSARAGVSSLTPTEWRVVELAAAGLTTRQVSEQLVVNPKTVESHLTHIYDKLGVKGRAALAGRLEDWRHESDTGQAP